MRSTTKIFSKADWVLVDVSGSPMFGPDGKGGITLGTNPVALPIFDFSQYDEVVWSIFCGGFTGATAFKPKIWGFDTLIHPGNFKNSYTNLMYDLGTAGGGQEIVMSTTKAQYTTAGTATLSDGPLVYTHKPLFAQLSLQVSGTMTALTSLRMSLYGISYGAP